MSQIELPGGVEPEMELVLAYGMCRISAGSNRNRDKVYCGFKGVTGSSDQLDPTFNQAAPITLIPDGRTQRGVPKGHRCYLDFLAVALQGNTTWTTSGTGLLVQDSAGNVVAMFPFSSLAAATQLAFPVAANYVPFLATAVSATNVTNAAVTFAGATFVVGNVLANQVATIVAGAGIGQSRLITANTGSVVTFSGVFETIPDATSVFEFRGQCASAGAAATITAMSGTPWTVNGLKDMFVVITDGTGAGQSRIIASNTNAVITVATNFLVQPDATSVFQITNNPDLLGACDYGIAQKWTKVTQPDKGLQIALRGAPGAGSPARFSYSGYFGPGV